jgi:hypothetical protein
VYPEHTGKPGWWNVPCACDGASPGLRGTLIARLGRILDEAESGPREVTSAAKAILSASQINRENISVAVKARARHDAHSPTRSPVGLFRDSGLHNSPKRPRANRAGARSIIEGAPAGRPRDTACRVRPDGDERSDP